MNGLSIIGERGANEDAISCIEKLLQKAKDGEIVGIAAAVQFADGSVSSPCGGFSRDTSMVGALMHHVVRLSR